MCATRLLGLNTRTSRSGEKIRPLGRRTTCAQPCRRAECARFSCWAAGSPRARDLQLTFVVAKVIARGTLAAIRRRSRRGQGAPDPRRTTRAPAHAVARARCDGRLSRSHLPASTGHAREPSREDRAGAHGSHESRGARHRQPSSTHAGHGSRASTSCARITRVSSKSWSRCVDAPRPPTTPSAWR